MPVTELAFYVGLALGALMIVSACTVLVLRSTLGSGGIVLSALGSLLIGMSVWTTASVSVSGTGMSVEFARQIEERMTSVEEQTETVSRDVSEVRNRTEVVERDVVRATETLSTALSDVAKATLDSRKEVVRLSATLASRRTIDRQAAQEIQRSLEGGPTLDPEALRELPKGLRLRNPPTVLNVK